jgi:glucosamine--fructose-6-phosphate aminotransferase (isomerizing)
MSTHFEREIRGQALTLRRLLSERAAFEAVGAAVRAFAPRFVVTAARGSSDNAARYAKYLLGAHNRLVVSLGAPSLLTLYGSPPDLRGALLLGISQSGESPDITALAAEGARQGALTIALTNVLESPLARACQYVLPLHAGPELAVAATKSYTAELTALAMLSVAMGAPQGDEQGGGSDGGGGGGRAQRWAELARVPDAVDETLALCPQEVVARAAALIDATTTRLFVVGRGFNFSTAFEIALKLKETAYLSAEAQAPPDLWHGPIAVIDAHVPAIVLAVAGPSLPELAPLLAEIGHRGAPLTIVSNVEPTATILATILAGAGSNPTALLPFSNALPEWLSPIAGVVPGQLLAAETARRRGYDPDRPRGLAKITKTH